MTKVELRPRVKATIVKHVSSIMLFRKLRPHVGTAREETLRMHVDATIGELTPADRWHGIASWQGGGGNEIASCALR